MRDHPCRHLVSQQVVASLIVIVTLLRHGRRVYTWSRFNQYQGTVQPRYDLPVHRAQQRPFSEPFYPVMPYGESRRICPRSGSSWPRPSPAYTQARPPQGNPLPWSPCHTIAQLPPRL